MIPQSSFMVLAPVDRGREDELRGLLASMTDAPGHAAPDNALVPFGKFDALHVARFVLLDDKTAGDISVYGVTPPTFPLYLAFVGDVDGDGDAFLETAAREAAHGLEAIFSCCEGFTGNGDLAAWMRRHRAPSAANYVNWRGRTVRRANEEAALYDAVQRYAAANEATFCCLPAREAHAALREFINGEIAAGRLTLTPDPPTPLGWQIRNALHLIGVPLLGLLASPVIAPLALIGLLRLRAMEKTDPELCDRCDAAWAAELARIEDHDVTNQFTAMGSLKPGIVRLWTAMAVFFAIDYAARHIYTRGNLARVRTIHFARWVFLDGKKRVVFMSNYDGSLESYMDDFINKVGFGLNLAFCSGVGYPTTKWLALEGCWDERKFKEYLRRHQQPSQVWYKAYPGRTAVDLERNRRVRGGLEAASLSEDDAREWVGLL